MKTTIIEKLEEYIDSVKVGLKPSTTAVYNRYMRSYIAPYFKDMPLSELDSTVLQGFVSNLSESGLSAVTVQAVYSFVKAGLKPSGKDALFDVALPKYSRQQVDFLTKAEQKQIELSAEKAGMPHQLYIMLGFYTGLRIGELCGLMWNDINFNRRTMQIRRTLSRIPSKDGKGTQIEISAPKSQSSERTIPLQEFLLEMLKKAKEDSASEYVLSLKGKHLEPRYIQSHFKRILKEADVRDVNFHTVRHTFATRALESRFDVKTLSEILGHNSATVTLDKYAHVLDEHKRNLMEQMAFDCDK